MKKIIVGMTAGFGLLSAVGVAQAVEVLTPSPTDPQQFDIAGSVAQGSEYWVDTAYDVEYVYTFDRPLSLYPDGVFPSSDYNEYASVTIGLNNGGSSDPVSGIGNSAFDLFLWDSATSNWSTGALATLTGSGTQATYSFLTHGFDDLGVERDIGVEAFKIVMTDWDLSLDPANLVTGLSFARKEDNVKFFQNPDGSVAVASPNPGTGTVPEPATFFLMGAGLLGMGWRSKQSAK